MTSTVPHSECIQGWLNPLLQRISSDRTIVACPLIDVIRDDDFAYVKALALHIGAFNWRLHFRWYSIPSREMARRLAMSQPIRSPTMAGGIFAMQRDWFFQLGAYDEKMDIWGGENLEMSFRVWQCGGSVEIVPCSHVAHVFRRTSPYSFPRSGGTMKVLNDNLIRVAKVWLDEWAELFFLLNPGEWV